MEENLYTFEVHTSDIKGAGTDANITCILYGEKGECSNLHPPLTRLIRAHGLELASNSTDVALDLISAYAAHCPIGWLLASAGNSNRGWGMTRLVDVWCSKCVFTMASLCR